MAEFEGNSLGDHALFALVSGRDPAPWAKAMEPQFTGPPLDRWNTLGSSQNWAPRYHAANRNWAWLRELVGVWSREGLFGREFGSPLYNPPVVAALMAWHRFDPCEESRSVLRAIWSLWSLAAVPSAIRRISWRVHPVDESQTPGSFDRRYERWRGPSVALAGDRWSRNALGPESGMLALALNWPDRFFLNAVADPTRDRTESSPFHPFPTGPPKGNTLELESGETVPVGRYRPPGLALSSTIQAARLPSYGEGESPPERWGLSSNERQALSTLIRHPTPELARTVASWVPFGCFKGYRRIQIRRWTEPDAASMACASLANGNKPGNPASLISEGIYRSIKPARFRGVGATLPRIDLGSGRVTAQADGVELALELPPGPTYVLEMSPDGLALVPQVVEKSARLRIDEGPPGDGAPETLPARTGERSVPPDRAPGYDRVRSALERALLVFAERPNLASERLASLIERVDPGNEGRSLARQLRERPEPVAPALAALLARLGIPKPRGRADLSLSNPRSLHRPDADDLALEELSLRAEESAKELATGLADWVGHFLDLTAAEASRLPLRREAHQVAEGLVDLVREALRS